MSSIKTNGEIPVYDGKRRLGVVHVARNGWAWWATSASRKALGPFQNRAAAESAVRRVAEAERETKA